MQELVTQPVLVLPLHLEQLLHFLLLLLPLDKSNPYLQRGFIFYNCSYFCFLGPSRGSSNSVTDVSISGSTVELTPATTVKMMRPLPLPIQIHLAVMMLMRFKILLVMMLFSSSTSVTNNSIVRIQVLNLPVLVPQVLVPPVLIPPVLVPPVLIPQLK